LYCAWEPFACMISSTWCEYEVPGMILLCNLQEVVSRDSSFGIALGCGLDDRGSRVWFLAGAGNFSLHHRIQNGSGAHPASYSMGIRGSFPGVKRPGVKLTTHLHLVPKSRMSGAIPPFPQYAVMVWCSVKGQGQLDLLLLTYREWCDMIVVKKCQSTFQLEPATISMH
jgi:hypothetical protein